MNTKVIDAEELNETLTTLYQGIPDYAQIQMQWVRKQMTPSLFNDML
ncbi:hypothetical protein [Alicyclobacillus suci]|nr:hypothetical protein [Alicyclobacillus suci]